MDFVYEKRLLLMMLAVSVVKLQFGDEEMGILGTLHYLMGNEEAILSARVYLVDKKGNKFGEEYYTEGYYYDQEN